MTEEELAKAAELMAESYDRFRASVLRHTEMMTAAIESIRSFEELLDHRLKKYDAQLELLKSLQDVLNALPPVLSETRATTQANTDRLDKFMDKIETYFGSGAGLEYDN